MSEKNKGDLHSDDDGHVHITDEEIGRILDNRPGGRKAGRGDSPWSQEFYEKTYGLKFPYDDWILATVLGDSFYDMKWFLDYGKSCMKPLVKKYSLARELYIKTKDMFSCKCFYGEDYEIHFKRIKYIVECSMENGWDDKYEKEPISYTDLEFTPREQNRYSSQARIRFNNEIDRLSKIEGDDEYRERIIIRELAFETAYLCLRSDDPLATCRILQKMVDGA